ncbi:MAG: glycosyl transferase family 1, partial [Thermotogae bacterium]
MRIDVANKAIEAYEHIIGLAEIEEIYSLANKLRNCQVVHVNATSFGGGVAEILHTLVPLTRSVGINAEWYTIEALQEFFNVTKLFHNTLQGADTPIEEHQWKIYEKYCQQNIEQI